MLSIATKGYLTGHEMSLGYTGPAIPPRYFNQVPTETASFVRNQVVMHQLLPNLVISKVVSFSHGLLAKAESNSMSLQ